MITCLSDAELNALSAGALSGGEVARLEEHLSACDACRAALARLAAPAPGAGGGVALVDCAALTLIGGSPATASTPRSAGKKAGSGTDLPPMSGNTPPRAVAAADANDELPDLGDPDLEILSKLAEGGQGAVYLARQRRLNRRVAVKVMSRAAFGGRGEAFERFRREAEKAGGLEHPNIVPVFDYVERGRLAYYVMSYVEGESLHQLIRRCSAAAAQSLSTAELRRRFAFVRESDYFRQIAAWTADAAETLHFAHERNVIHRDIKPANLLIDRTGRLLITDFGLAKDQADPVMTTPGSLLGTAAYASPEQARGDENADHRTDIYSLGATLYELLTFRPPFNGANVQQILDRVKTDEPTRPREVVPEIPAALEMICLKAMRKDARDRHESCAQFAEELRNWLAAPPKPSAAVPIPPIPTAASSAASRANAQIDLPGWPDDSSANRSPRDRPPKRGRRGLFVGVAAMMALVGIGIYAIPMVRSAAGDTATADRLDGGDLDSHAADAASQSDQSIETPPSVLLVVHEKRATEAEFAEPKGPVEHLLAAALASQTQRTLNLTGDAFDPAQSESAMLPIARSAGADYLIWGDATAVYDGPRSDGWHNWRPLLNLTVIDVATGRRIKTIACDHHGDIFPSASATECELEPFKQAAEESVPKIAKAIGDHWSSNGAASPSKNTTAKRSQTPPILVADRRPEPAPAPVAVALTDASFSARWTSATPLDVKIAWFVPSNNHAPVEDSPYAKSGFTSAKIPVNVLPDGLHFLALRVLANTAQSAQVSVAVRFPGYTYDLTQSFLSGDYRFLGIEVANGEARLVYNDFLPPADPAHHASSGVHDVEVQAGWRGRSPVDVRLQLATPRGFVGGFDHPYDVRGFSRISLPRGSPLPDGQYRLQLLVPAGGAVHSTQVSYLVKFRDYVFESAVGESLLEGTNHEIVLELNSGRVTEVSNTWR